MSYIIISNLDEYETERRKELQKQGASPVGEDGTKNRRSQCKTVVGMIPVYTIMSVCKMRL